MKKVNGSQETAGESTKTTSDTGGNCKGRLLEHRNDLPAIRVLNFILFYLFIGRCSEAEGVNKRNCL